MTPRAGDGSADDVGDWASQQRAWMQTLRDPQEPLPWASWTGGLRTPAAAGAVYVNNVRANVIAALSQSYPATRACLGERRFDRLVVDGLRSHPPFSGDLAEYGDWLPEALGEFLRYAPLQGDAAIDDREADLVWLARLEWALDQARCIGGGDEPIAWTSADAARDMQRADWPQARARLRGPWQVWLLTDARRQVLAQAGTLLRTRWLADTRAEAESCGAPGAGCAPAHDALLQHASDLLALSASDLAWIMALDVGATFASATEQTLAAWPRWTPARILAVCLEHGLLGPPCFASMPTPP